MGDPFDRYLIGDEYEHASAPRCVPGVQTWSGPGGRVFTQPPRGYLSTGSWLTDITLWLDRQPTWPPLAPVAALARAVEVRDEIRARLRAAVAVLRHGEPDRW